MFMMNTSVDKVYLVAGGVLTTDRIRPKRRRTSSLVQFIRKYNITDQNRPPLLDSIATAG